MERIKNNIKPVNIMYIFLGVSILSLAINIFFAPNDVVVGGFSGIAIILQSVTKNIVDGGIPLSVTNLVLNIPLFIASYYMFGKGYLGKTVFATVLFSAALQVGSALPKYEGDYTLIAIYGGILDGLGVGLVLRAMASTGGVDLLASLIHKKLRHVSVSKIMFVINAVIIASGFFVFGAEKAMYGVISVFISSNFVNIVLEGLSFSKVAFIISEKSDEIAKEIMETHSRGVTSLNGRGMYTGKEKDVLFCVFSKKEITAIKDVVRKHDPSAFLIVSEVKEVMGEGFKSLDTPD